MVALEVMQVGLAAQNFENQVGELSFPSIRVFRRLVCTGVSGLLACCEIVTGMTYCEGSI